MTIEFVIIMLYIYKKKGKVIMNIQFSFNKMMTHKGFVKNLSLKGKRLNLGNDNDKFVFIKYKRKYYVKKDGFCYQISKPRLRNPYKGAVEE